MAIPLLTLHLKHKRDLLRIRQMTRQAAGLLGFDGTDQVCLVAAVFDLACQAFTPACRATVCFEIADDQFCVVCTSQSKTRHRPPDKRHTFQLNKPLPPLASAVRDDVRWMLQQLAELAPLDLFGEICKMNQELLQMLLERPPQSEVPANRADPSAA